MKWAIEGELLYTPQNGYFLASFVGGEWLHDNDIDVSLLSASEDIVDKGFEAAIEKYVYPKCSFYIPGDYGIRLINQNIELESLCLCQYSGVVAICPKDAESEITERNGESYFLPVPGGKRFADNFYSTDLGQNYHQEWLKATLNAMRRYDLNKDGILLGTEVMVAVQEQKMLDVLWLARVSNCTLVNGVNHLIFMYHWLQRVAASTDNMEAQLINQAYYDANLPVPRADIGLCAIERQMWIVCPFRGGLDQSHDLRSWIWGFFDWRPQMHDTSKMHQPTQHREEDPIVEFNLQAAKTLASDRHCRF